MGIVCKSISNILLYFQNPQIIKKDVLKLVVACTVLLVNPVRPHVQMIGVDTSRRSCARGALRCRLLSAKSKAYFAVAFCYGFPLPTSSRLLPARPTLELRFPGSFKKLVVRAPIAVLEVSNHKRIVSALD